MIKWIYNKLFGISNPYKEVIDTILEHNTIMFWLDKDGNEYAQIYIRDTSEESAKKLGEMISRVNEGFYTDELIKLLIEISKTDTVINEYVREVIVHWHARVSNNFNKEEDPHIKPTDFSFQNISTNKNDE